MTEQTTNLAFEKLHPRIQKWCHRQGWASLRSIQSDSVGPVLAADRDVIISASTSAGKTEAAFLPACSKLLESDLSGVGILYISPLKALINDQERRLLELGESIGIDVTPWHGDVAAGKKNKYKRNPDGILLITPESLESFLLNHAGRTVQSLKNVSYFVIDEFHAFVGTVRGQQLLSLMARLEFMIERKVPRIALSATLGDMGQVEKLLNDDRGFRIQTIKSTERQKTPEISYVGLVDDRNQKPAGKKKDSEKKVQPARVYFNIASDLFQHYRGSHNLVFANSRADTEKLSTLLAEYSDEHAIENQFFPHHGSLSKEHREWVESRLQARSEPTTAVCTMTLELGIDIGDVDKVAQVFSPASVSSLRQRLGRSGRRSGKPCLNVYIAEKELSEKSHIADKLRLDTFQTVAIVDLLVAGMYESPNTEQLHLSTFVQQTLSVIGQYGGVRPNQVWHLLCNQGPFKNISVSIYKKFLRALGHSELITQTNDGLLVLGAEGERLVNQYTFYTAFTTSVDYILEYEGKVIGTLPAGRPVAEGQFVIFGGKRWEVKEVISERFRIKLAPAGVGDTPQFGGNGPPVHDIVRERMCLVYKHGSSPRYLDEAGERYFKEGQEVFYQHSLDDGSVHDYQGGSFLMIWKGGRIIDTLKYFLEANGEKVVDSGPILECPNLSAAELRERLQAVKSENEESLTKIFDTVRNPALEKFDDYLSDELQCLSFASRVFDVSEMRTWLESIL